MDSMQKIGDINSLIIESKLSGEISTKEISDVHHTFGELYRHRRTLFVLYAIYYLKYHGNQKNILTKKMILCFVTVLWQELILLKELPHII